MQTLKVSLLFTLKAFLKDRGINERDVLLTEKSLTVKSSAVTIQGRANGTPMPAFKAWEGKEGKQSKGWKKIRG